MSNKKIFTLSDDSIQMIKNDAELNHKSGLKNYDLYLELVSENPAIKKTLGHIIISAQIDFENAMNLYGTIKLYRNDFNTKRVSRSFYLKMQTIWQEIKLLNSERKNVN